MEKIITIRTKDDIIFYSLLACSENVSRELFLMNGFLMRYAKTVQIGIKEFEKLSNSRLIDGGFQIEYGDPEYGDDFYVSFIDDMYDKECEDENGWIDVDCLPRLKFSYENFDHILQTWARLQLLKPRYLIIVKHESEWVDIWGREELSEEEKQLVENDEDYKWNREKLQEEGIELF